MQTTTAPAATTKAILAPGLRSDEHTVIALSCLVSFMFVISVVALAYALRNRKRRSRSSEDEIAKGKDRVETISNKGAPENIPENTYVNVVECLSNDPNGTVTYSEVTILSGSSWRPTPENTEYDTVNVSRGASVKSTAEPET
ncbi:hypothetical protein AGOR_G00133730 [Albula goreensis]|uniref:Uncharacterized protein n=1 Tax=Albula goreensis TaxID=1534307 RepID=A0A8T3D8R7_9TELE|nr:hypothetical protein AGOR_G00133730 [Albula goreensis]